MQEGVASGSAQAVTKELISRSFHVAGYLVDFKKNVECLENKVKMLTSRKMDVFLRIDAATRNDELILDAVVTWLKRVVVVEVEAKIICDKAALVDKKYKGWLHSRFSLSRKARHKIDSIQELLEEVNGFKDTVSHPKPVQDLGSAGNFIPIGDYQAFASREPIKAQIIQAFEYKNVSLVGVYGVEGVGKTMFVSALANDVKKNKIFQDVVMVSLAQKPHVQKIQGDVAIQIGLKFQEDDILLSRAQRLSHVLNRNRKTLIILDDVRERVDLAAVGIPYKDGCKNCKILFTTRDEDVCKHMDTQIRINIGVLSAEESWELFRQKAAGDSGTLNSPSFQAVGRQISNWCGGIPLDIVTVGRALHGEDQLAVWKYTLRQQIIIRMHLKTTSTNR